LIFKIPDEEVNKKENLFTEKYGFKDSVKNEMFLGEEKNKEKIVACLH
jgi:hypothetical protein